MKQRGRKAKYTEAQKGAMCLDYYTDPDMSLDDFAGKYGIGRATAARYYREWKAAQKAIVDAEQTAAIDDPDVNTDGAVYFGDDQLPGQMTIYDYINDTTNSTNAGNAEAEWDAEHNIPAN